MAKRIVTDGKEQGMRTDGVTLATIAGGKVEKLFQAELDVVLRDIEDPNRPPKMKRRIVMTFDFKPDDSGAVAGISVRAVSKISERAPATANVRLTRQAGVPMAIEIAQEQEHLFDAEDAH